MKNLLLLLLLSTALCAKGHAQAGVEIVNDPKATAQLSFIQSLNQDINNAISSVNKATSTMSNFQTLSNDAAKVVTTLATLSIITQLLVDLQCEMKKLSSSVQIVDQMNNCEFKLAYNLMLMKLQGTTDLIKVAIVGGNLYMALNDKTNALKTVMITLEGSIRDMHTINNQIRISALNMLRTRYSTTNSSNYKGLIATQR